MYKLIAIICALILTLSLAACGGSGAATSAPSQTTAAKQETAAVQDADDGQNEEDASPSGAEGDLSALAEIFVEAYMGVTEAGETVYYACDADGGLAILLFYDISSNNNVSFVGPATVDGNAITIADVNNGLQFTFTLEIAEDDGVVIDTGDSGLAIMAECDVSEVLEAMQAIGDYSEALL